MNPENLMTNDNRWKWVGFTYWLPCGEDDLVDGAIHIPEVMFEEFQPYLEMAVISLECGKESGRLHWQGALKFSQPKSLNQLRQMPWHNGTASFKKKTGSPGQFFNYCRKEHPAATRYNDGTFVDGPWYFPSEEHIDAHLEKCGEQGKRTDIHDYVSAISAGATAAELAVSFPVQHLKFYRGGIQLRKDLGLNRVRNVPSIRVIALVGNPGTGKTHWLLNNVGTGPNVFWKSDNSKWWDGITQEHSTIVLNDFDSSTMKLGELKRLFDTGPFPVQSKGSVTQVLATTFYVSMNRHPKKLYSGKKLLKNGVIKRGPLRGFGWNPRNPLWRRFDDITLFEDVYQHPEGGRSRKDTAVNFVDPYSDDDSSEQMDQGQRERVYGRGANDPVMDEADVPMDVDAGMTYDVYQEARRRALMNRMDIE